jgi:uncharacterized protein (DUF305 family)
MRWIAACMLLWAGAAVAQPMQNMPGMAPPAAAPAHVIPGAAFAPYNDAVRDYHAADDKMMSGMGAPYTGDADYDFVSHMVPHHQGAIDMAEVELKYGTDPHLKQLATRVIAAQKAEIGFMNGWLTKHKPRSGMGHGPGNAQWK